MPIESTLAWHMGLIPLLYLAVRRRASTAEWLIAIGFSVSWFADFAGSIAPHLWEAVCLYPAVQFSFFAVAAGAGLWFPVLMAALVFAEIPWWLLLAVGSLGALVYAAGTRYGLLMLLYCGVGSLFHLGMIVSREDPAAFMTLWWPYQVTRLAAIVAFLALVHPQRKAVPA